MHGIRLSTETIRKWMISVTLWKPRVKKRRKIYQPRTRRDCIDELIQLDGSPHDRFEGRAFKELSIALICVNTPQEQRRQSRMNPVKYDQTK